MATNKYNLINMIKKTAKTYNVQTNGLEDVPRLAYVLYNAGQWSSSELLSEYCDRMALYIKGEFDLGVSANATDA